MSRLDTVEAVRDLDRHLRRLRDARTRFADAPVRGLAAFIEGPEHRDHFLLHNADAGIRFLNTGRHHVTLARPMTHGLPHSGPYYAYIHNHLPAETLAAQVAALTPVLDGFFQTLGMLSPRVSRPLLPADLTSGWEAVFHLACHFPRTQFGVFRGRWERPGGDPATLPWYRDEFLTRFAGPRGEMHDIHSHVIWAGLEDDFWASTEAALERVRDFLEPPDPAPAADFADLHARFTAVGRAFPSYDALRSVRPRVVKFGGTFDTPPTAEWCDFPLHIECQKLPLSRNHADAEYLVYRDAVEGYGELWAEAGRALAGVAVDGPVMFTCETLFESPAYRAAWHCGPAYLNPAPAARWARFVFRTLRGDGVEVRWRNPPAGPEDFDRPLYGDAVLATDFAAASALAIERAGLLCRSGQVGLTAIAEPAASAITPATVSPTTPAKSDVPKASRPDGPEGGQWLWYGGKQHPIERGVTYLILEYMWSRDAARFEELMGDGGFVWEESRGGGAVSTAICRVNKGLPPGVPWRLRSSGKTRFVRKEYR
jgi:hypothetical protein